MSFLGVLAGVGPGMTAGADAKEKRAASKSERIIAEAEEGRKKQMHIWKQQTARDFETRNLLEDPIAWDQEFRFRQGQGPVAPDPTILTPLPSTIQQALPGVNDALTAGNIRYQEGGAINVPAVAGEAAGEITPSPAPVQQAAAQQPAPQTTRRDRYNQWYSQAAKNAVLTGGLEGYKMFQEMENATSRRQVMGYGLQAARALNEGNVGEAMRAGNSALEVTPFDTGLRFEAIEGQLHMVGKDGKPGVPLKAQHLMAFVDDHMKTPEKYLEWKQQTETERAAREGEKIERFKAQTERGKLNLDRQFREQETDAKTLTALAAYRNSEAYADRVARLAAAGANNGWDNNNILAIRRDTEAWDLNNWDPLHDKIKLHFRENPIAQEDFRNDVMEIQVNNPWDESTGSGSVGRSLAAVISQLVRRPGGVTDKELGLEKGDFNISTHPNAPGYLIANYKGQLVTLPKVMHGDAIRMYPHLAEDLSKGRQQAPPPPPDPDPASSSGPTPPSNFETLRQEQLAQAAALPTDQLPNPTGAFNELGGILATPFRKPDTPRHAPRRQAEEERLLASK